MPRSPNCNEDVGELLNRRGSPLWLPEPAVVSIAIPTPTANPGRSQTVKVKGQK